jgi:hypothetical protein
LSIGGTGITLNGPGTYIFRTTEALNTAAGTAVTLGPGVSECDVWWTAIGATTLGANSTFAGTVIDAAGITIGSTVTWGGRALAFGGTVTTDTDTLTSPTCNVALPPPPVPAASLTVTKIVVNDDDGTLAANDFPLFVNGQSVTSGVATTTLAPGAYTVTETGDAGYVAGDWSGDCAADGTITLADEDVATCTITNDDIEPAAGGGGGGGSHRSRRPDPIATTTDTTVAPVQATTTPADALGTSSGASSTPSTNVGVPKLPNAGLPPDTSMPAAFAAVLAALSSVLAIVSLRKKAVRVSTDEG